MRYAARLLLLLFVISLLPTAMEAPASAHDTAVSAGVASPAALHSTRAVLADLPPGGSFTDDNGSAFEGAIEAIAAAGITQGCNPPDNDRFCPNANVTRGEIAVFLSRAFGYSVEDRDFFIDDEGEFYENAANRIRTAEVTNGCNPPTNNRFCGDKFLSRAQMAALLVRAMGLTNDGGGDLFVDDDGSVFENAIDRLGAAKITAGCNPPTNDEFCPNDRVKRGQMAAFISRALGLSPITPPPASGIVTGTITGNACPCKVTGTVELKGSVNLQGDIMVDGGTLVARPGVDVDGNGFQIMFMNGGKADFQGSRTSTWSGNGSNANVSRDINFRNMRRIMWHQDGGKSTLRYFAVIDSGTPSLGDYPLHWHLNGNRVSGTIVEGVAVVNGRHHAFVPHGSHGITFKNTIAKNTRDSAYWWDPAGTNNCSGVRKTCTTDNSNNIVYDQALAVGVRPMADERGDRLAGFNLGAGSGNVIRNSVATGVSGGRDCAGFVWPEDANQNVGGTVWSFSGNASWNSNCHGAFTWQNDGSHHVINGFNGSGIGHGAYLNDYEYRNVDIPYIEVHAAGWKVVGGRIGTVITLKHRNTSEHTALFQDVAIDSFVIRNAVDSGEIPGIYVLNNTGLTCSDIQYESVVPGTRVVINGTDC